MANEPRGKGPSWKTPGAGGGAAKGPAPSRKHDWQAGAPAAKPVRKSRRGRLLLAAFCGAVLLAAIVYVIVRLQPTHQPRIVLVGPGYDTSLALPANSYGAKGMQELAEWLKLDKNRPHLAQDPATAIKGDEWAQGLQTGTEKAVVLFLSLHGGADKNDEPFLWLTPPTAAAAKDDAYFKNRLRIVDVLAELAKIDAKKGKLLILDATQVQANWGTGMLHNDFARALKNLDSKIAAVPNLVVICASDVDQRSWVSEEHQKSIFTHYVLEALKGGTGKDIVTAATLFEYVAKKVPAWVRDNRNETQTPLLLPEKDGPSIAGSIQLSNVPPSSFAATTPSAASSGYPDDLKSAWLTRDLLAGSIPPPEFVAPQVWRRYLDLLLRAEQLQRAGANYSAILGELRTLEPALSRSPWPTLTSLANAVPMPEAVGVAPPKERLAAKDFQRLWDATDGGERSRAKVWAELRASAEQQRDEGALIWWQRDVVAMLYKALDTDERPPTPENLATAEKIIREVFGVTAPPSEAHFLLILQRDLDAKRPDVQRLRKALRTRRLAEEVALTVPDPTKTTDFPASELVYPWFRQEIADADVLRLRGEDLLFSTNADDWTKSDGLLGKAAERYADIRGRADRVRFALNTRNQILAELPYYARWVAGLRDEFTDTHSRELLELVEKIAQGAHQLSGELQKPDTEKLKSLDASALKGEFTKLKEEHSALAAKLKSAALQSNWHKLDNVLLVPFIPAEDRRELVLSLMRASATLSKPDGKADAVTVDKKAVELKALEAAKRQGRMALAVLGEPWIMDKLARDNAPPEAASFSYSELSQRIREPRLGVETIQYEAARQLGWHWRELARETTLVTKRAEGEQLAPALTSLTRADTLARLLDSAHALPEKLEPVVNYRRHRLHHFLLGQARRVLDAGWAEATPKAIPNAKVTFAEQSGERFVADAKRLLVPDPGIDPEVRDRLWAAAKPIENALKIPIWQLQAARPSEDMTDQDREIELSFTLTPPVGHPAGYPQLRWQLDGPVSPEGLFEGRQSLGQFTADKPPVNLPLKLTLKVDADRAKTKPTGSVALEVMYRGHLITTTVALAMTRDPSTVWAYKPPAGPGGFAVMSDPGLQAGTVVILLDRSNSMIWDDTGTKRLRKYLDAVGALEAILAKLPAQTIVSLYMFGENNGKGNSPLFQLLSAQAHNFKNNGDALTKLIDKLKAYNDDKYDYRFTPLARSIREVISKNMFGDEKGSKTILVLTDGMDTVDEDAAGGMVLEALREQDVSLQMVFFQAGKEEEKALKQFGAIKNLNPPGELWTANDQATLIQNLNEAMQPQLLVLRDKAPERRIHNDVRRGMRARPPERNQYEWSPGLEPGLYQVRTTGSRPATLSLDPGDRLLLELRRRGVQLEFYPHRYTDDAIPRELTQLRSMSDDKLVQLAIARSKLQSRGGLYDLEMLFLLDREFPGATELSLTKPHFMWFEIRTQNRDENPPLARMCEIENVPHYPASAWRVRVPKWPAQPGETNVLKSPAMPNVSAWWLDNWPRNAQLVERRPAVPLESDFDGKKVTVNGAEITIDSVRIENRYLVVKLQYPAGKPAVLVRPVGLKDKAEFTLEQEHRFYEKVGKYTARFGPLSKTEEEARFTLEIHSLENIKRDGKAVKINMTDAPGEREMFPVPQPVKLSDK